MFKKCFVKIDLPIDFPLLAGRFERMNAPPRSSRLLATSALVLAALLAAVSMNAARSSAEGLIAYDPLNAIDGGKIVDVSGNDRTAFGEFIDVAEALHT